MNGIRLFKLTTDNKIYYIFAYSEIEAEHLLVDTYYPELLDDELSDLYDKEEVEIKPGIAIETNN